MVYLFLAGTDACYDRGGIMVYHFLAGTGACYDRGGHHGIPLFGWNGTRATVEVYRFLAGVPHFRSLRKKKN